MVKPSNNNLAVNEGTHDSRRSTRVPLKVTVEVKGRGYGFKCIGETVNVSLHGALIQTHAALRADEPISIYVHWSRKRAAARTVYISSENPLMCGIELEQPGNIWGVSLPPDDWGG